VRLGRSLALPERSDDLALPRVLGILTLIPLVGLIVLLIVNGKATNLLREDGIHVGLLGARMSDLDRWVG
jgi:hypothetical protein